MPVYNGGCYFRLAIQSALAQSYDNIEIVVVNDGSTDGGKTDAIAQEYKSRIVYIRQENKGVAGALNTAIAHMTGDFFTWLSHDDIHLANKVGRQVEYAAQIAKPDAILFSDYDLIDAEGGRVATVRLPHQRMVEAPMLSLLQGYINGCTLFIPTWIMHQYGPFDERLRYTQDYELWNSILADHEFFHQPEVLIQYRTHPGQDSHKLGAVTEGDALWTRMLDSRSEVERVQLFGSRRRYFASMARFLDKTPYKRAAAYAHDQIPLAVPDTLVSVVMPFWNEVTLACRALRSVLAQTHGRVEVIAVDDGSTEDTTELKALALRDPRVRLVRQANAGPGAARNHGMREALGDYIAFLDAEDLFLPHKVQRQMELMQRDGHVLSHTSYYVTYPERSAGLGLLRSGAFTGKVYPAIIASCPIATPTVMLHRTVVSAGFEFTTGSCIAEDVLTWIELTARYEILGIDEPLSVVEWSGTSAALSQEKSVLGLMNILAGVCEHPVHGRCAEQIESLRGTLRRLAQLWKTQGPDEILALQVAAAFGAPD